MKLRPIDFPLRTEGRFLYKASGDFLMTAADTVLARDLVRRLNRDQRGAGPFAAAKRLLKGRER